MDQIEHICSNGVPLCYIVRATLQPEKTMFLTPSEFNLQVGYIVYPEGAEIPRHLHAHVERQLETTAEVLVVRKGVCEIDIYDDQQELVATRELHVGDVMIMVAGGHGFRMTEDTVLLEVKQGPYVGADQKELF
jgi:quercetin dioxygenase-like cupin family protein